jgi:D-alanyl-D-alanine carboxypeptidase
VSRVLLAVLATLALAACTSSQDASAPSSSASRESSPSPESPSPEAPSGETPSAPSSPSRSASSPTGETWTRALPRFAATTSPVTPALERRMRWSHRDGCPVPLGDLRYLRVSYVGFDGHARTGELVVHREVAGDVVSVFRRLYAARWPIARMRLVDAYRGDDDLSMAADNTSAYNCRRVAGSTSWSEHAFGKAIDLNPVQNPYVQSGSVDPPEGRRYADLDRSAGAPANPGVVREGDVVVRAFAEIGWEWGGHWTSSKDYQHFSLSGR